MSPSPVPSIRRHGRSGTRVAGAALASAAALALAACGGAGTSATTSPTTSTGAAPGGTTSTASQAAGSPTSGATTSGGATHAGAHWGYSGEAGPAHWGDLDPAYTLCRTGTRQSPVDLAGTRDAQLPDLMLDYPAGPVTILDNGHTVQMTPGPAGGSGASMTAEGTRYELVQFHVHTPAEHTVAGRTYPAEIHFVHKAADGRLAVLGVLVSEGAANPVLETLTAAMPTTEGATARPTGSVDPTGLLPQDRRYIAYSGSLTTPPCSENVDWHVLPAPITASTAQLDRLRAVEGQNNRPVQPTNGRELRRDTGQGA